MQTENKNPLQKYNKLKRFSDFVSETIQGIVSGGTAPPLSFEVQLVDCLNNGDIYTKRDLWEKLDAIADCASIVEIRKYDTGEVKIHNANYCHNPVVCPICADRVSKRRRAIFTEPLKRAARKFYVDKCCGDWKLDWPENYTGVYLATATVRNGPNLKERIDLVQDSIRRMIRKGQKRGNGRGRGEWSKVRAAIGNTEIKIGTTSDEWHVHIHFLIFTDAPINIKVKDSEYYVDYNGSRIQVSKFNYEWWESTGGEGINFDLKPIHYRRDVHGRTCETAEESIEAQAQEVIKYSSSLSGKKGTGALDRSRYIELIQRRGNRRLFNAYGLLRCDKRNPESLMTITERELRRLEYVDSMDCKSYEVFSSMWQKGGTYQEPKKQDGAIFASSDDISTKWINLRRRAFSAQTAIYQGEYRKQRNDLFKTRFMHSDSDKFEMVLDESRDAFRNKVSTLWQKYGDNDFIPEFLTAFDSPGFAGYREKYCLKAA